MWQRRRRLVVVHQNAGPTVEGVLVHRSMDCYRIANPRLLEAEGARPCHWTAWSRSSTA
jgi:hypothetical protein